MHTDEQSPIERFRGTCCYSSTARRGAALPPGIQHSPDCLCSYMCTAFKHVKFYQREERREEKGNTYSTGTSWIVFISKPSLFN